MIKGSTHQEVKSDPKSLCTKQQSCKVHEAKLIELKDEIDKSTNVVEDFN